MSDSGAEAGSAGRGRGVGLVLLAGAVLAGGWWVASLALEGPTPEPVFDGGGPEVAFVGDRACAECHPGAAVAHAGSGHARTLCRAAEHPIAGRVVTLEAADPERPGSSWSYGREGDRLIAERREAGEVERYLLDWAFGSGQHAVTFVGFRGEPGGEPLGREHRLTYFKHLDGLGVTPGQGPEGAGEGKTPHGLELTAFETRLCFNCHATRICEGRGDRFEPAALIANVSCERCHGPGGGHVEAARAGRSGADLALPFGNDRASALEEIKLCGECHRLPAMAPDEAIRPDNPAIARFQPIGLLQSACFRKGDGRMTCTTCHDPHARAEPDRAAYEASCLSCHPGAGGGRGKKPCPVSPRSGCVDCHMPEVETGNGLTFTDHWIRARP